MNLYGFALLPSVEIQERLIEFQRRHEDTVGEPRLGLDTNLPHTSVLQHPYDPGVDYEPYLGVVEHPIESEWTEFYYQPKGWLFAGVRKTNQLDKLHRRLFDRTKQHIDTAQIGDHPDLAALTPQEQANYRAYGYRYLGDLYRPHVTIGRTLDDVTTADETVVRDFELEFFGKTVRYDRLAFYEAGEFGALKRIVCMRQLTD